MYFKNI